MRIIAIILSLLATAGIHAQDTFRYEYREEMPWIQIWEYEAESINDRATRFLRQDVRLQVTTWPGRQILQGRITRDQEYRPLIDCAVPSREMKRLRFVFDDDVEILMEDCQSTPYAEEFFGEFGLYNSTTRSVTERGSTYHEETLDISDLGDTRRPGGYPMIYPRSQAYDFRRALGYAFTVSRLYTQDYYNARRRYREHILDVCGEGKVHFVEYWTGPRRENPSWALGGLTRINSLPYRFSLPGSGVQFEIQRDYSIWRVANGHAFASCD